LTFFSIDINQSLIKDYKQLLKLAVPIMLSQLGVVLMGVADTVMVGWLGEDELAGINQGNNIFFMLNGITLGMILGVNTLVSIKVGESKRNKCLSTFIGSILISLMVFIIELIIILFLINNFGILRQEGAINIITPQYLEIVIWSILPLLFFTSTRQLTDGLGYTKISLWVNLMGLLMNIFLNGALIYGWFDFPELGYIGCAWATLYSRIFMMIIGFGYLLFSNSVKDVMKVPMPSFSEVKEQIKEIFKIGLPISLETTAEWACLAFCGVMVGWYGSVQMAAHAVAWNAVSVTFMMASGISIAGNILVGYGYGEQNAKKIRIAAFTTVSSVVTLQTINSIVFLLFHKQIANAYGVEGEAVKIILPLFVFASLFQVFDGLQITLKSLLRGIKDVLWVSVISVFAYWAVTIPMGYVLADIYDYKAIGVWIGISVGFIIASLLSAYRMSHSFKRLPF